MSTEDGGRGSIWKVPTAAVVPLWRQCAKHIEGLIRGGTLKPGQALPAHTEMAAMTGVGASTLQKALAWLTAEGLLVRHRRRGTFVAEQPNGDRETWVAVMTRAMFDPSLSQWDLLAARAVVDVLSDAGVPFRFYHNAYVDGRPDAMNQDIDPRLPEDIEAGRVRALLVVGSVPACHPELRDQLKQTKIPLVETSGKGRRTPYVVEFDRPAFIRCAVERAAAQGCRRLALLETPDFEPNGRDLLGTTFAEETKRLGMVLATPHPIRIPWIPSVAKGLAAFERLWRHTRPRPDGLVATDEYVALGAAQAALSAGVAVPETLWIITSFTAGTEIAWPVPVETIAFDPVELIDRAWQMLQARMDGRVVNRRQIRIEPRGTERRKRCGSAGMREREGAAVGD